MMESPSPNALGATLLKVLGSEEVSDVLLRGTNDGDEMTVPALKGILAAWSTVFRRMFFSGNFAEASSRVVNVNYEGEVILWLVEFCYTSSISFFETTKDLEDPEKKSVTEEVVTHVLSLLAAADYYEIDALKTYTTAWLLALMEKNPWIACFAYGTTEAEKTIDNRFVFHHVKKNFKKVFEDEAELRYLSPESMKKLVVQTDVCATEFSVFSCILKWAQIHTNDPPAKRTRRLKQSSPQKIRWNQAVEMAKSIDLSKIPPKQLRSTVKESGLVSLEALCAAYESQMLLMEVQTPSSGLNNVCDLPRSSFNGSLLVSVEGAGVRGANGVYTAVDISSRVPVYMKRGQWKGSYSTFEIVWSRDRWHIYSTSHSIYSVPNSCKQCVPSTGWKAAREEYKPEPLLVVDNVTL